MKSEQINELAAALSKAQAEFPSIPKTKKVNMQLQNGRSIKYNYADLADVISITSKVLSKFGLSVNHETQILDKELVLVTTLRHSSGQWTDSTFPLKYHEKPQEMGSELTYLRRYTLTAILGIQADEDEDGEAASIGEIRKPQAAPKVQPRANPSVMEQPAFSSENDVPMNWPEPGTDLDEIPNQTKRIPDCETCKIPLIPSKFDVGHFYCKNYKSPGVHTKF